MTKSFYAIWAASAVLALAGWLSLDATYLESVQNARTARLVQCEALPADRSVAGAEYTQQVLFKDHNGVAHSPSIVEHDDGTLQAIWFAGEDEALPDTGLYQARFEEGKWTEPTLVLSAESESVERGMHFNTIGNPVLSNAAGGSSWLYYVSPSMGGWATARVSARQSSDQGQSWEEAKPLRTSPFFNMSTLVKQPAACLEHGLTALPVYFEMVVHYGILAILNKEGDVVGLRRMYEDRPEGIQPLVLAAGGAKFDGYIRPTRQMRDRVYVSSSSDGGLAWANAEPTNLPNPGAPVCGVTLEDGSTLLGFNNSADRRAYFNLAYKEADAAEWQLLDHEFGEGGNERKFAYCTMIRDRSGRFHLVFSERRSGEIIHVSFTDEWMKSRL